MRVLRTLFRVVVALFCNSGVMFFFTVGVVPPARVSASPNGGGREGFLLRCAGCAGCKGGEREIRDSKRPLPTSLMNFTIFRNEGKKSVLLCCSPPPPLFPPVNASTHAHTEPFGHSNESHFFVALFLWRCARTSFN